MELPSHLKTLYGHWHLHTGQGDRPLPSDPIYEELKKFIEERLEIWKKKVAGSPTPFTQDPILSQYRFCNIFREFDRQTIEFHTLLNPLRDNFPLWLLNMFYCRMVARPETIQKLGLLSYNQRHNEELYKKFLKLPKPKFGSPYLFPISTIQSSPTPTRELFTTKHLPKVMEEISSEVESWDKISIYEGVERILPNFGFNLRFLWTEVLIDTAYQYPERLDLFKKFPIGPGALSTLKRLNKDPHDLSKIRINTGITYDGKPLRLSAENWEGVACEFRKYTNLRAGHGRKRLYK